MPVEGLFRPGGRATVGAQMGAIRVVLAEDNALMREGISRLVGSHDDFELVGTAPDLPQLLTLIEEQDPHVVVTDLKMPGMDGIELVKRIRAHESPAAVIVMTAFGAVETAVDAMRAGAADYLTKPLNFDELLVVLDKVLETVVNNLEVTNNLDIQPEIHCRVLLTGTLESFSIGHTIILSRGFF